MSAHPETNSFTEAPAPERSPLWWLSTVLFSGFLGLCAFVLYFLPAAMNGPLTRSAPARSAALARSMLQTHDFIQPLAVGDPATLRPPVCAWLTVCSTELLRADPGDPQAFARAALLGPAVCAALAVFLAALFGSTLFCRAAGVSAALILGASEFFVRAAQTGDEAAVLALACMLAACGAARILARRNAPLWTFVSACGLALAILLSGPAPLVWLGLALVLSALGDRAVLTPGRAGWLALALVLGTGLALGVLALFEHRQPGTFWALLTGAAASAEPLPAALLGAGRFVPLTPLEAACAGLLPFTPVLLVLPFLRLLPAHVPGGDLRARALATFLAYCALAGVGTLFYGGGSELTVTAFFPAFALASGTLIASLSFPGGVREEYAGWMQLLLGVAIAALLTAAGLWPAFAQDLAATRWLGGRVAEAAARLNTWAYPLAFCALILTFVFMRLWIVGRGVCTLICVASLTAGLHLYQTVRRETQEHHNRFSKNLDELRTRTAVYPSNARLYSAGRDTAVLAYYLGRPLLPLDSVLRGPEPAADIPVLLARERIAALKRDFGIAAEAPESSSETLLAIIRKDDPGIVKLRADIQNSNKKTD